MRMVSVRAEEEKISFAYEMIFCITAGGTTVTINWSYIANVIVYLRTENSVKCNLKLQWVDANIRCPKVKEKEAERVSECQSSDEEINNASKLWTTTTVHRFVMDNERAMKMLSHGRVLTNRFHIGHRLTIAKRDGVILIERNKIIISVCFGINWENGT